MVSGIKYFAQNLMHLGYMKDKKVLTYSLGCVGFNASGQIMAMFFVTMVSTKDGIDDYAAALILSQGALAAVVAIPIVGYLLDRLHPDPVLVSSLTLLASALANFAMPYVEGYALVSVIMALALVAGASGQTSSSHDTSSKGWIMLVSILAMAARGACAFN